MKYHPQCKEQSLSYKNKTIDRAKDSVFYYDDVKNNAVSRNSVQEWLKVKSQHLIRIKNKQLNEWIRKLIIKLWDKKPWTLPSGNKEIIIC